MSPRRVAQGRKQCSHCRNNTPAAKARRKRYERSDARKAVQQRSNRKRVWVGREYHSFVSTAALAQAINAHVRQRVRAFRQGGASATES